MSNHRLFCHNAEPKVIFVAHNLSDSVRLVSGTVVWVYGDIRNDNLLNKNISLKSFDTHHIEPLSKMEARRIGQIIISAALKMINMNTNLMRNNSACRTSTSAYALMKHNFRNAKQFLIKYKMFLPAM